MDIVGATKPSMFDRPKESMDCYYPSGPPTNRDFFAAPIIQIFSVFVSTNFDECQIYGHIRATEIKDATSFDLYSRDPSEYETISRDGALSLSGPQGHAILGNNSGVTIDFCLKDRTRNIELINVQHYLDCVNDDSRDKLIKAVIHGEHGSVCVYYTTFRFSVYAIVEIAICKYLDPTAHFDDVHGSIVASYSNSRRYCRTDDEVKYLETNLFAAPSDKSVKVTGGFPIKLLRSVVAVPAYSSLVIKVDLSSPPRVLSRDRLEFYFREYSKTISFGNGHAEVKLTWKHAYPRLYKESVFQYLTKCTKSDTDESDTDEPPQQLALSESTPVSDQPLISSSNPNSKSKIRTWTGVEIFSVYVGGIDHEVSTLYGSIEVNGGSGSFLIYNRNESDVEPLLDDKTVCIEFQRTVTNEHFSIILDLKDPVHGLDISQAEICWDIGKVSYGSSMSWFDKRICSVGQGKDGYAAVHYMIFKHAVEAIVEVSLTCDDLSVDVPFSLYGLICASYSEYDYSTEYEKLYYKSRLFKKQGDNPQKLHSGDKVTLLKSVMVVPLSSSLIIEADLKLICNGDSHEEVVFGEQDFSIDVGETICKEIGEGGCRVKVSVTFDDSFFWGKRQW